MFQDNGSPLKKRLMDLLKSPEKILKVGKQPDSQRILLKIISLAMGAVLLAGTSTASFAGESSTESVESYIKSYVKKMDSEHNTQHNVIVRSANTKEIDQEIDKHPEEFGNQSRDSVVMSLVVALKTAVDNKDSCIVGPYTEHLTNIKLENLFELTSGISRKYFDIQKDQRNYIEKIINIHDEFDNAQKYNIYQNGSSQTIDQLVHESSADQKSIQYWLTVPDKHARDAIETFRAYRLISGVHKILLDGQSDHATMTSLDNDLVISSENVEKYYNELKDFVDDVDSVMSVSLPDYPEDVVTKHNYFLDNPRTIPSAIKSMFDEGLFSGRGREIAVDYLVAIDRLAPKLIDNDIVQDVSNELARQMRPF